MKLIRIIILLLIAGAVTGFIWITAGSDAQSMLFDRLATSDGHLWVVVVVLSLLILLSTLTGLPVFYFSMALGFMLTLAPALLLSLVVNLVAVMAAFFMVRSVFTSYFSERYGQKKLIKRINKRIDKYGLWTVVFSRGIYILPTNIINFSFPLSRISRGRYFLGTLIGLIPECLINVLTGYLLKHEIILLSSPETRTWQALVIGGFIVLATLSFILLRHRQKRRKKFDRLKEVVPYDA